MRFSLTVRVLLLALVLLRNALGASPSTNAVCRLVPDPSMQGLLDQIHAGRSIDDVTNALSELKAACAGHLAFCFPQLIYYRAEVKRKHLQDQMASADLEKRLAATYIILREIAPTQDDWKRVDWKLGVLDSITPYAGADDPLVAEQVKWILKKMDYAGVKNVDFGAYEQFLRDKPQESGATLIKYMYLRDPQAALSSMAHVYGNRAVETEIATTLKGNPKAALQSLVERPEWWVHLYVAETMKKQPQLRDAALIKKLEKDDHPLVKEKVAEITSGR
jgi:hypothetical protein